ncbi:glycogen debranching N-terminal domain-containing protein [Plantactinospora sp. WMMB782]|uniref:amylo-alpha-1,6-glucosidase n=1 Tax=Plantactinospora sp. WMMB782 TaxID=3404121 RepID=UPI003B9366AF
MNDGLVRILDGQTFMVSDGRGDIDATPAMPTGMFALDTRHLSSWQLTIDGERLTALSVDEHSYFEARFFLVPGAPTHYVDAKLSVIRRQRIAEELTEQITVLNHQTEPVDLVLRVEADSDFADLFEIKDVQQKKGEYYRRCVDGALHLGYRRSTFRRETHIVPSGQPQIDAAGLTFPVRIEPGGAWSTELRVRARALGPDGRDLRSRLNAPPRSEHVLRRDLDEWLTNAPELRTESEELRRTYRRSLVDLAALRFPPLSRQEVSLPAAGLPWFMTLFGRDSILTSLQTLPFVPELAATTLRSLASLQGGKLDDFREEEPGKIMHEIRRGETAAFEEQPHSPYYGTADATALFVVLLDEYHRWSGDDALVKTLEPEARAALAWLDSYGDLLGNGYTWYQRRNESTGLDNQCWKDSWDGISYRDGRLPRFPRATCELQGYAHDARVRAARLAREIWQDPEFADRLERDASALKRRFNDDFWVQDGRFYAVALDSGGERVDSLTSNIGHLLWSGIVEETRAATIAGHLLGSRLFSGWGVRTLATGDRRYNPVGYHVGTVWPFDNSFIAWGLWRYGFRTEAGLVAKAILDAAECFQGRLPEAFAGYERDLTEVPVLYPTACSPQAWSAGAPLLLLRVVLGLEPDGDRLSVDPALPDGMAPVSLLGVPGRWGRSDVSSAGSAT